MIKMIVAVDRNFGIGYKDDLLFKISDDLKRFRRLTMGHFVVMGRKTYESLPNPLNGRVNVVMTNKKDYQPKDSNVIVENDASKVINHYRNTGKQDKDIYIIGGAEIYKLFAKYADTIYLTFIDKEAENVDTFFPKEVLHGFDLDKKTQGRMFDEQENCLILYNKYNRKEDV